MIQESNDLDVQIVTQDLSESSASPHFMGDYEGPPFMDLLSHSYRVVGYWVSSRASLVKTKKLVQEIRK